jgi:hypothetical protein
MEITHNNYQVKYDADIHTVTCSGSFRLTGDEYAAITDLLNAAADAKPSSLTLDLRNLQFLNSSGIHTLSKYVIHLRNDNITQVTVKGSNAIPWQRKSLANLERLLPSLQLELE